MECLWCVKDEKANALLLEQFCSSESTVKMHDMNRDLLECYDCVVAYHAAKTYLLESQPSALKELNSWEIERLTKHFKKVLSPTESTSSDGDSEIEDFLQADVTMYFGFGDGYQLKSKLSIPLQEVLLFPYLLWDKELDKMVVRALISLEEAGSPLILNNKLPGIYLMLVHPNCQVRKWARKSVNYLGSVSCDDYDDLSEVLKWVLGVPEFGLFDCLDLCDNPVNQTNYTILPSHLFIQNSVKEFWLGICMFIKALKDTTIRLQLVSRDNHQGFVGVVVNALDQSTAMDKEKAHGSESEFWPVLHCFVILLERLGSRLWQHVVLKDAQMKVFQMITKHPAYVRELRLWPGYPQDEQQASSASCDDEAGGVSASQMVYSWDGRGKTSSDRSMARSDLAQSFTAKGKRQKVVFAWFKPYITSVVDFGNVGAAVIRTVLKYIHDLKVEYDDLSEGYDNTVTALVICLHQLFKSAMRSMLTVASDLWITDVIQVLGLVANKPTRAQKLANAFCKSVLERMAKKGANVTSLRQWISDEQSLTNPDSQMLSRLRNLFKNYFKSEVTSPLAGRMFDRERRMIIQPKRSRSSSANSTINTSISDGSPSPQPTQASPVAAPEKDYKFVMGSKSPPFVTGAKKPKGTNTDVELNKTRSAVRTKVEERSPAAAAVKTKVEERSPGKTILDYCHRQDETTKPGLLEPKIQIEKLKVVKNNDVIVLSESDDFLSTAFSSKKKSDGIKTTDLKVRRKKLIRKKEKKEVSYTSSENESGSKRGKSSSTGNSTVPKRSKSSPTPTSTVSKSPRRQNNSDPVKLLNDHSEDDFLDNICNQIENKYSPNAAQGDKAKNKRKSTSSHSREKRFKVEERELQYNDTIVMDNEKYIVISDDSCSELDDVPLRDKRRTKDVKPSPAEPKYKVESEDSWIIIDNIKDSDEEENVVEVKPKIKQLNKKNKTRLRDMRIELDSSDVDIKPRITGNINVVSVSNEEIDDAILADANIENEISIRNADVDIKPKITDEKTMEVRKTSSPTLQFNNNDIWDDELMMYADNDHDILFSCLDIRDSMDTMTCVEADLNDDNEITILSSDAEDTAAGPSERNKPVTIKTEFMTNNYDYLTTGLYSNFSDDQSSQPKKASRVKLENKTTVSENAATSFDHKTKVYDHSAEIPDHTATIPDNSVTILDHTATPFAHTTTDSDVTATVSDTTASLSDTTASVSDTTTSVSNVVTTVSDVTATISTTVSGVSTTMSDVTATVSDVKATIPDVKTTSSDHTATIFDGKTTVSDDATTVSDHTATVSNHKATVSGHAVTVADHTATVSNHKAIVSDHTATALDDQEIDEKRKTGVDAKTTAKEKPISAKEDSSAQVKGKSFGSFVAKLKSKLIKTKPGILKPPVTGDGKQPGQRQANHVQNNTVGDSDDFSRENNESAKIGVVRPYSHTAPPKDVPVVPPSHLSKHTSLPATTKPPQPVKKSSSEIITKPRRPTCLEEFYFVILRWNANNLSKKPIRAPNIVDSGKVRRTFQTMDEYYKVFKPLVFLEVWAQIHREWKETLSKSTQRVYKLVVDSVNRFVANFQLIKCTVSFPLNDKAMEILLRDNDLVMIEVRNNSGPDPYQLFAVVDGVTREVCHGRPGEDAARGGAQLELTITLRMLDCVPSPIVRETLTCTFVTSLMTSYRKWKGLMFLPNSVLARDILSPRPVTCKTDAVVMPQNQAKETNPFNDSQLEAIERTCHAIRKPYPIPKICFIQGPPGTGKSHTVIGLIKKHLKHRKETLESERENQLPGSSANSGLNQTSGRILLCAPSNAAIDVLVRRLVAEMKSNEDEFGPGKGKNCGSVNIVRVGRFASVHRQVQPFTLDVLTKTEVAKLAAGDEKAGEEVKAKLEEVRLLIDVLEKECYVLRCSGYEADSEQVKHVNSKIEDLMKKKKPMELECSRLRMHRNARRRQEENLRKEILFSADIICSTLNSSGSYMLSSELLSSNRKHLPFSCVIVDEACQSCELDVLIPLQFGSSKLVLVGDPEQLPTTILSQKAQELLFGQSLFERHYRVFRARAHSIGKALHATKDNPIQMLDVQYRMHPEIAVFPSTHVYQGRLKNARSVITRSTISPLKHYLMLNIRNGRERPGASASVCNPVECDFVLEICTTLRETLQERHIGVITPYRAQVTLLTGRLRERGLDKIEVNTVDGFQGREKEVIIMSCVRANGQTKGIGFLADRQRMNVALTRGRYSLVILLHAESLVTNKDWKACIDDAKKRGFYHDISSPSDLKVAFHNEPLRSPDWSMSSPLRGDPSPLVGVPGRKAETRIPEQDDTSKKGAPSDPRKQSGKVRLRPNHNKSQGGENDKPKHKIVSATTIGPQSISTKDNSGILDVVRRKTPGTATSGVSVPGVSNPGVSIPGVLTTTAATPGVLTAAVSTRGVELPDIFGLSRIQNSANATLNGNNGTGNLSASKELVGQRPEGGNAPGMIVNPASRDPRKMKPGTDNKRKAVGDKSAVKRQKVAENDTAHASNAAVKTDGGRKVRFAFPEETSANQLATGSDQAEPVSSGQFQEPVLSQVADDFDFDDFEPDEDTTTSAPVEPLRPNPPSVASRSFHDNARDGLVNDKILDRVMSSGGAMLAQNNPYLQQLMQHERRDEHARNVRDERARHPRDQHERNARDEHSWNPRGEPSRNSRDSRYPRDKPARYTRDEPARNTRDDSTWFQQDEHAWDTRDERVPSFKDDVNAPRRPLGPNRAQPGPESGELNNVIARVAAKHPRRAPTPVVDQGDALASFTRYHGGRRERVAHTGTRDRTNIEPLRDAYTRRVVGPPQEQVRHRPPPLLMPTNRFKRSKYTWTRKHN